MLDHNNISNEKCFFTKKYQKKLLPQTDKLDAAKVCKEQTLQLSIQKRNTQNILFMVLSQDE